MRNYQTTHAPPPLQINLPQRPAMPVEAVLEQKAQRTGYGQISSVKANMAQSTSVSKM